jgi:transcriptional regulator with XRE-family HTH domain
MSNFANILIALRKSNGITQEELSTELKVSRSAIGMYETSKREPDLDMLSVIADYFGVSIDQLAGRKEFTERQLGGLTRWHSEEERAVKLNEWNKRYNPNGRLAEETRHIEQMVRAARGSGGVVEIETFAHLLRDCGFKSEAEVLEAFSVLNEHGKIEAAKRVGEMVHIDRYRLDNGPTSVPTPRGR